ncbi:MAG TPA: hypothetical protein VFN88_08205, partial [Caulobacteraceae bacterium]|nr:hypothetical protein [Caulobacteraceae bacterium]
MIDADIARADPRRPLRTARLIWTAWPMTSFELSALFLSLVAVVGWLNSRFWRLPNGVVMVLAGVVGAALLAALRRLAPESMEDFVQPI